MHHKPYTIHFAQAILDKYKDCPFPGRFALPVSCNQRMNDYIKDLCELCEFNDKSGVGRLSATSGVQTTNLVYWLQAGKTVGILRCASESTAIGYQRREHP